jgi:hypothetical protein
MFGRRRKTVPTENYITPNTQSFKDTINLNYIQVNTRPLGYKRCTPKT